MNKTELIKEVSKKTGYAKTDVGTVFNTIVDVMSEALTAKDYVQFGTFGKFIITERSARNCRNPLTGETMYVPAYDVVKFKPSSALKEAVK